MPTRCRAAARPNTAVTLTTANSPASVVIDGSGRFVTGNANIFTVGSGVTLTLKNFNFVKIPFTVSAGGKLVLTQARLFVKTRGRK